MPYNDRKVPKSRNSSWTREDQHRWDERRKRDEAQRKHATESRRRMLDAMGADERQAYLDAEQESERMRAEEAQARQAKYQRDLMERKQALVSDARLTAGYLQSELAASVGYKDAHGLDGGDWLDDPVAAKVGDGGFGEEVRTSGGIKLQVNVCLDISNSMYYNSLADVAVTAVRALYLSLNLAAQQLPDGSLTVNAWTWAGDEDGKSVKWLNDPDQFDFVAPFENDEDPEGTAMAQLPRFGSAWTGEDTWLYPLLEKLEDWENEYGDASAYRLDLIISDGILEHKTDPGRGDIIQDRRDGMLQTVVLNFLPIEEWADYRVPNKCIQYPADVNNLFGLMRQILGDWLVSI